MVSRSSMNFFQAFFSQLLVTAMIIHLFNNLTSVQTETSINPLTMQMAWIEMDYNLMFSSPSVYYKKNIPKRIIVCSSS